MDEATRLRAQITKLKRQTDDLRAIVVSLDAERVRHDAELVALKEAFDKIASKT